MWPASAGGAHQPERAAPTSSSTATATVSSSTTRNRPRSWAQRAAWSCPAPMTHRLGNRSSLRAAKPSTGAARGLACGRVSERRTRLVLPVPELDSTVPGAHIVLLDPFLDVEAVDDGVVAELREF